MKSHSNPFTGNTALTRRQALARMGVAAGCLAAPAAWSGQAAHSTRSSCEIKGGERMLRMLDEDRQARALPREADCPELLSLRHLYDDLPHELGMVRTQRQGNDVNLAFEKRGYAGADHVVVMIHGLLADRETWVYVAGALGATHQLWLIDLPGCGSSDCPSPSDLEADAFSPTGMADRVLQVMAHCLHQRVAEGRRMPRVTIAGHSLGGTVCLRMAGDPELRRRHAATLKQVQGMILFAPADVAINTEISSFMTVLGLSGAKVRLGQVLGVVNDQVRAITREAYHVRPCATQEQAERFTHTLTDMRHLRAAQAMIRTAVPWCEDEHRPDWPGIKQVEASYANVEMPCVITWGEWDETLTECMGHKIRDKVPAARLVEIEGAGHCLPSEVPLHCAQIIATTETMIEDNRIEELAPVTLYGDPPLPDVASSGGWPALPPRHDKSQVVIALGH